MSLVPIYQDDGQLALPLKYDFVNSFRDGLAQISQGKVSGYIDQSGEFVWRTTT